MKTMSLGGVLLSSRIAYGCMPLGGSWDHHGVISAQAQQKAVAAVRAAIDAGITFFDHADIYCRGLSETVFAQALKEIGCARARLVLQSKVGIRFGGDPGAGSPGRYDFSYEHIVASVEGSLKRLGTDYLDIYLLHRPDALVEPDEVARAFDLLHHSGKVRWFGVSNHNRGDIELLQSCLKQPLVVNQLELSLVHSELIHAGLVANQQHIGHGAEGILAFCRVHNITVQAWGPLANGRALGSQENPKAAKLATVVGEIAAKHKVDAQAIPVAWLLRHPAGIQPILGTTNPARIAASCAADRVSLDRDDWYRLLEAGTRPRGGVSASAPAASTPSPEHP